MFLLQDLSIIFTSFNVVFRFYRYVLEPSILFNEDGSISSGPSSVFRDIPETPLLTMNLDIPQAWMVEAVKSPYDLDNIFLKEVSTSLTMFKHIGQGFCYRQ